MSKPPLPTGLRILKALVLAMGVILFISTIALFIAVYIKFNKPLASDHTLLMEQVQPSTQTQEITQKCSFKPTANIEMEGDIINSSVSGNILTLTVEDDAKPPIVNKIRDGNSVTFTTTPAVEAKQQIIIFDLCEGRVLSRLNVLEHEQQ